MRISFKKPKATIVFIHGITSWKGSHKEFEIWAKRNNYDFYSFDLPGHGKNITNYDPTFQTMLDYSIEKIQEIKSDEIILLGHSMGGAIVSSIYPVFKNKIKALIYEDPLTPNVKKRTSNDYKIALNFAINKLRDNNKRELLTNNKFLEKKDLFFNLLKKETFAKIEQGIKEIFCPVLLLVGESDAIVPPEATSLYFKEFVSDLTCITIMNAKHSPSIENAIDYCRHIELFLKNKVK